MTVFVFTDKTQKIFGGVHGDLLIEFVLILICIIYLSYIVFFSFRKKKTNNLTNVFAVFFLLLMGNKFIDDFHSRNHFIDEYNSFVEIYQNKEYQITEGVVKVLHEQPESGHDRGDVIKIGQVLFELSCFSNTFAYNKTVVFGGILTEGTFARVFYYQTEDNTPSGRIILRIDLLDEEINKPIKQIDPLLPCAG